LAQARAADWNCGEDIAPLSLSSLMAGDAGSSGKCKTPCERMQAAYLTNWLSEDLLSAVELAVELAVDLAVELAVAPVVAPPAGTSVVVVLSLATPALEEAPPHAAVTRARPIMAGVTSSSRGPRPDRAHSPAPVGDRQWRRRSPRRSRAAI